MSPTLEEVMQSKSITKYRLSKESGIPWATLSDICNGKTNLDKCEAGTVRRLSQALDMTMEEILDLENCTVRSTAAGKPIDPDYLERDLPPHLDKCINDLKDAVNRKEKYIDTYLDDLYGSINSAYWDGEISEEQANYIRDKYLGL